MSGKPGLNPPPYPNGQDRQPQASARGMTKVAVRQHPHSPGHFRKDYADPPRDATGPPGLMRDLHGTLRPRPKQWLASSASGQRVFDLGLCVHVLFLNEEVNRFRTLTLHAVAVIPPIHFGPLLKPTSRGVGGAAADT